MVTHPRSNPVLTPFVRELICLPSGCSRLRSPTLAAVFSQTLSNLFSCCCRILSLLHHPPLPPIFYSRCFPFTLASRVTANIVFLVLLLLIIIILSLISCSYGCSTSAHPPLQDSTQQNRTQSQQSKSREASTSLIIFRCSLSS